MYTLTAGDARRRLVSLVLLTSVFVCAVASTGTAGPLEGRILDPDGQPVAGAAVLALRGQDVVVATTSSTSGRYGPLELSDGRYDIVVIAAGLTLPATTVTIAGTAAVTRDFRLVLASRQESVLVSAAHVDTTTSRAASSTTVLTRPDLERLQVTQLTDALRVVPGINAAPSGTTGAQTSLFPRGGESDYTLVLVDGVPQNAFGGAFDAAHLATVNADRIEVVRGPQSALYGSGAIGGIVHLVTANGGQPEASFTLDGGGYGQRAGTASAVSSNGPWSFGGGFDWLASDGDGRSFTSIGGPVTNDDYARTSAAGSVAWSNDPGRRVRVDVRGGRNERGFPGPYGSDPDGRYSGLDTISRGTNRHASVGVSALLRSGAAVDHRANVTWGRADGTFVSPFGESEDESGRMTARYQVDARLGRTGLSAGTEVLRERALNTFITDEAFSPIPVRRSNVGLFVEARTALHERLLATVGVRTERIDRVRLAGDGFRPAFDSSVVWSTNPKVSASWLARRAAADGGVGDTRVRLSAGTGIKAPTAFDIAFTDNPDLRPERSRSVDVGVEQTLWQSRVTLDAAWFRNSYDDLIVTVTQPLASASRYRTDNIANARSSGIETGVALRLSRALSARVNYAWLDTEVLGVDSLPNRAFAYYAVGDALVRRPRHSASIDVRYVEARWSAFALIHHRGDMRDLEPNWASSVYTNPGRAVATLGASLRVARSLEVYGRLVNAFDRQYEDVFGFPALGRSAVVGLRVTAGR